MNDNEQGLENLARAIIELVEKEERIVRKNYEHNQKNGRYITNDDLTNLNITLNTINSIDELLEVM